MSFDRLSRRAFVQVGLLAFPAVLKAQEAAPPAFRTLRHQFTELDPVWPLRPTRLRRPDGGTGVLSSRQGRVLLLNLWASWCPTCRTDLPNLAAARAMLTAQGIDIVTVSTDTLAARDVDGFLRGLAVGDLPVFLDPDGQILGGDLPNGSRSPFSTAGAPVSFIVDARGGVRGYLIGQADWGRGDAVDFLKSYLGA